MRTRRTTTIERLRLAIDCLPRATRVAMLEGIRANSIIVGAYSTREGICPMLAAHRTGGRTNCISFAKAWDRFTLAGAKRADPRRATERELKILTAHLEMSLLEEEGGSAGLAGAIAEHRALMEARSVVSAGAEAAQERKARSRRRPGDPDRSKELRRRGGWSWTRIVRRYDDFEATVRDAETAADTTRAVRDAETAADSARAVA
jgi:hypothetical protein